MKSLQALFGGTFDPVHYGHLKPVGTLTNLTGLTQVTTVPNNAPPHHPQSKANSVQRKHMLELVITGRPLLILDEREPERNAPSHTTQTLKEWRQEQRPDVSLTPTIGQDSLLTFPTRYEYEIMLDNVHLITRWRPGYLPEMTQPQHRQWLEDHLTHSPEDLHLQPADKIYLTEAPWFNISTTIIRGRLQSGESYEDLLPGPVLTYTNQQSLYR